MLAGGGVQGGQVYGRSDRLAAYPAAEPVSPADLTATVYHALGIPPGATLQTTGSQPRAATFDFVYSTTAGSNYAATNNQPTLATTETMK